MGSLVVGVAGAVVGSFFGAPEIGWLVGSVVGGILFPQKQPSPRINDVRIQNSAYGQPIPWLYGMFRIAGNMIWAGQPVQSEQGGKGGGKAPGQPVVNMSFAVGLCEGPITGVRRIWANGKIIYDVSNPSNFEALSGSAQMVTNFTVYLGNETQQPDPTMEAALGAGNVPAHRGLAYVVFNNLDLSPWGNFLPSFTFEVVTQQQPTYSSVLASSWTDPVGGITYFRTPNLSATGGESLGYHPSGSNLLRDVQLNAYQGLLQGTFTGTPQPTNISGIPQGYSDTPGLLAQCPAGNWGWWTAGGHYQDIGTWSGNIGAGEATFVKQGQYIWVTDNYGAGAYPITYSKLGPQDGGVGTPIASTTISKSFTIIGLSSSYLYAWNATDNLLCQFNRTTLALVNTWPYSVGLTMGFVVDDRHVYMFSGTLVVFDAVAGVFTTLGSFSLPMQASSMWVVNEQFLVFAGDAPYSTAIAFAAAAFPAGPGNGVLLSSVVADICARAGLSGTQYDVSQLTDTVDGYAVTAHATPRDALSPLMQAYFFDVSDTDGKLKFVKRGTSPTATFAWADLGAAASESDHAYQNPIVETVMQEVDLPRSLTMSYIGYQNDYQEGSQQAFRTVTASNKDAKVSLAIVMSDDDAIQRTQELLLSSWMARTSFEFKSGLKYLAYEPGDVTWLQKQDGSLQTVRLVSCQYDGMGTLAWTAVAEFPGLYGSSTAAGGSTSVGLSKDKLSYSGPTDLVVMDVPPLRDQDTSPGLYVACCGYATDWPGAQVEVSRDSSSYTSVETATTAATMGVTTTALPNFGGGNQPDELSTVTVQMVNGTLSSVSYTDFMAGNQVAYIGGELVYFRNAALVGTNTYTLSGFLRGLKGTDRLMAGHGPTEQFVLVSGAGIGLTGINVGDLGTKLYYEAFLLNQFSSLNPTKTSLTPVDGCVRPLHPVQLAAGHGSAASASDISLQWVRQARVNTTWNSGTDVPLDESTESYLVNVSDSAGNLKRQVTVLGPFTSPAIPNCVYTAAQITADGFSAGQTINFSVAQNSDQGVLGWAATTSIAR